MSEKIRFAVLTNGRSGSNFLVNALNQHPALVNYGEVLGDWTTPWKMRRWLGASNDEPAAIARFLDGFFESRFRFYAGQAVAARDRTRREAPVKFKRWANIRAIGLKDFQLNFDRRGVGDYLARREDIRVIGLTRLDPVRRHLSRSMLQKTGQAAARAGERPAFEKLTLEPTSFLKGIRVVAEENKRLDDALGAIDDARKLVFDYDDYFGDADAMAGYNDAMFRLLSLEPVAILGEHRKLNTRSLRDTIENYDEIAAAARGGDFEKFFLE